MKTTVRVSEVRRDTGAVSNGQWSVTIEYGGNNPDKAANSVVFLVDHADEESVHVLMCIAETLVVVADNIQRCMHNKETMQ